MRILFVLLVLSSVSYGQQPFSGINCEDVDGLKVETPLEIPKCYTGVIYYCFNGKVRELKNYKCGKKNGVQKQWWPNGQLESEFNYKDGNPDGFGKQWYLNGQLESENNYKEGKKEGIHRTWYENGQLWYECNYKEGNLDGVYRWWYENGQLFEEANYKDGSLDGIRRIWYENGQLSTEVNYKNGQEDGVYKSWYENGQLEYEENLKDDGIIDDKVVYYNEDGAILGTAYYEDGYYVRCEGECRRRDRGAASGGESSSGSVSADMCDCD